jgi:hypothetical protein
MSVFAGPEFSQGGLVLAYDMANTNKSWKGQPTTNLLPSPSINGRFTTSNGWGSYNANQYNNNQYFSIGTITSVTDNIVTTSAAHPLRTFDVVTPQTTGGGVTAGGNYFVKRINSTQFSLHAYNSTENGSQGFINTSTGFHKVHDSIALDQRVSINATGFPTMWWGPPHLPNSALVKEVLDGVGPDGQSVMRLHIHRTDNVVDGMAYGVYTPVTTGDTINVSYWVRTSYSGKTMLYTTYFGAGISAFNETVTATSQWVRVKHQWTSPATFSFYQYWFPAASTDARYWIDICDLQVEVNTQNGATPFVAGTRTNTQALVDLTNNNTITLNSLVYNSNNTFSFNGSTNYKSFTNPITPSQPYTVIQWAKPAVALSAGAIPPTGVNRRTTLVGPGPVWNPGIWVTSDNIRVHSNADYRDVSISWADTTYRMIGQTFDGTQSRVIYNGELYVGTATGYSVASPTTILIGAETTTGSGTNWNGDIPITLFYNRVLTAQEIRQHFNALRGRFGI